MKTKLLVGLFLLIVSFPPREKARGKVPPADNQGPARSIIEELNLIPRPGFFGFKESLPQFTAKTLEPYQADYANLEELKALLRKNPEKYPVRAAILSAIKVLGESARGPTLTFVAPPLGPQKKDTILKVQKKVGEDLFHLEEALGELREVDRNKETQRRWQAHYDFALAALKARIVFDYEYTFMLGQVRREILPPLVPGHPGWKMVPSQNMQMTEPKVRILQNQVVADWKKIEKDYPGTPWEVFAIRERISLRGLEWRSSP